MCCSTVYYLHSAQSWLAILSLTVSQTKRSFDEESLFKSPSLHNLAEIYKLKMNSTVRDAVASESKKVRIQGKGHGE